MTEVEVALRAKAVADAPAVPAQAALRPASRTLRDLRSRLVDLVLLRSDLRGAEGRVAERLSAPERPRTPMDTATSRRLLLTTAAILCLLAAGLAATSQAVAAGLAGVIAVLAAILAKRLSVDVQAARDDRAVGNCGCRTTRSGAGCPDRGPHSRCTSAGRATRLQCATGTWSPSTPRRRTSPCNCAPDSIKTEMPAAVERLREDAKRAHEVAQRLRTNATALRAEADNIVLLTRATSRGHQSHHCNGVGVRRVNRPSPRLRRRRPPSGILVEQRRERDREKSAVQVLTQEATDARNVANRLGTEFAELQKLVELDQAARVGVAEESALALAVSLEFAAVPEPDELEVKAQQLDNQIRARQERDREVTEVEQLRLRAETARGVVSDASAVGGPRPARPRRDACGLGGVESRKRMPRVATSRHRTTVLCVRGAATRARRATRQHGCGHGQNHGRAPRVLARLFMIWPSGRARLLAPTPNSPRTRLRASVIGSRLTRRFELEQARVGP